MRRVLVLSELMLARLSLAALIRQQAPDWEVTAEHPDGLAARLAGPAVPDLVLVHEDKFDANDLRRIKERVGRIPCVAVAPSFGLVEQVCATLIGFDGLLVTSQPGEVMVQSLRAILGGQRIHQPANTALIAGMLAAAQAAEGDARLSQPDLDLLRGTALGLTDRDLAGYIGTTPGNVRSRMFRLYAKAGVANRIQLIRWAREKGYIVPAPEADPLKTENRGRR